MRLKASSLLVLSVLCSLPSLTAQERKTSQRIGDLAVTLVGVEVRDNQDDHHKIVVRLQAENAGKHALCARLGATLKATFGLQYRGIANSLQISELLPGEKVEGEYEFSVKNGVEPLQILLKPLSEALTCDMANRVLWHDEAKFDLTGPATRSSQEMTPPSVQQPATAQVRIFLTVTKSGKDDVNAIKTFHDHCPQIQITTDRGKADFVVELTPTSFKQPKHAVTVTSRAGDVVHAGATHSLGNAVKDACAAALSVQAGGR
jgi:hypothetical protein